MAPEEPTGLGLKSLRRSLKLQRVGGRRSGFVSGLAGSRLCRFPLGILPDSRTFLSKASRGPAVLPLDPGPGNSYVSAYPWPGALVLGAGCLQPSLGLSPSPCSTPPGLVRELNLALPDLTLEWNSALLFVYNSGTPWTCVPHLPAGHSTSCAISQG